MTWKKRQSYSFAIKSLGAHCTQMRIGINSFFNLGGEKTLRQVNKTRENYLNNSNADIERSRFHLGPGRRKFQYLVFLRRTKFFQNTNYILEVERNERSTCVFSELTQTHIRQSCCAQEQRRQGSHAIHAFPAVAFQVRQKRVSCATSSPGGNETCDHRRRCKESTKSANQPVPQGAIQIHKVQKRAGRLVTTY